MSKKRDREMLDKLISRDGYIVSQDNLVAGGFGMLSAFEHRLLDYCISFIRPDSKKDEIYTLEIAELLKYFHLNEGGGNYKRVMEAVHGLKYTPLYLPNFIKNEDGTFFYEENKYGKKQRIQKGWIFSSAFGENVTVNYDGTITFSFSNDVASFLFQLKRDFFQIPLSELRLIKGKYELILLKLWQAEQRDYKKETVIKGTVDQWQTWYLGENRRVASNIFKRDMLDKSRKQLEEDLGVETELKRITKGRKLIGYEMTIIDNRKNKKMIS